MQRAFLSLILRRTPGAVKWLLIATALIDVLPTGVAGEGDGAKPDGQEVGRALATMYIKNRDSFERIDCRYQLRHFASGAAESDVVLDRLQPDAIAEGKLLRDGAKERREVDVTDADLEDGLRNGHIIFDTKHQLLDGDRGLYYARDLKGSVLYSSAYSAKRDVTGPFSWGLFSFPHDTGNVDSVLTRPDGMQVVRVLQVPDLDEPAAAVPSAELIGIECRENMKEVTLRVQFFLAPHHGYLSVVCRKYFDDKLQEKVVITDVRKVDDERFFPMRHIHF